MSAGGGSPSSRQAFHPFLLARRGQMAFRALAVVFGVLLVQFFRLQIIQHDQYALSDGNQVGLEAMPETLALGSEGQTLAQSKSDFNALVRQYKRQLVMEALQAAGNDKNHTANLLGISRSYLFKLIKLLDIPGARQRRNLRAVEDADSQASAD